jgi:predicted amidohydrolase
MDSREGLRVTSAELVVAYRKAKADAYYERDHATAFAFNEYEQSLSIRLAALEERLNEANERWEADPAFVGTYSYIPKGLSPDSLPTLPPTVKRASFIASDPRRQWNQDCDTMRNSGARSKFRAKFRVVGRHSVEFHIVCALWILRVGHKFDALLGRDIRGSRLRRVKSATGENQGEPNRIAVASFRRYAPDFRAWRSKGLSTIREALARNERVVAITADLKAFYHRASSDYLLNDKFLAATGLGLTEEDKNFTRRIQQALRFWNMQVPGASEDGWLGLPVGISAPRVIANVLLWGFDRFVEQELNPLYYGRYVDDVFIVLRDNRDFKNAAEVWSYIVSRASSQSDGYLEHPSLAFSTSEDGEDVLGLALPYSKNSQLMFGAEKSKVFCLEGESGLDMLNSIEDVIAQASSEWRLLPDLPEDEERMGIEFLSAGRDASADVDNLRKSDGLSVKKLRLAIRLRNLEAVERDLSPADWAPHRRQFFKAVRMHAICAKGLFEFAPYIPRFVGLAVACGDWYEAKECITQLAEAFNTLERDTDYDPHQLSLCMDHLCRSVEEAIAKALISDQPAPSEEVLAPIVAELEKIGAPLSASQLLVTAQGLFDRDLGRRAWRENFLDEQTSVPSTPDLIALLPDEMRATGIEQALDFFCSIGAIKSDQRNIPAPLVFPTRPFTTAEITLLDRTCLTSAAKLRRVAQGVRGATLDIHDGPHHQEPPTDSQSIYGPLPPIRVVDSQMPKLPYIALACFATEELSWNASVAQLKDPFAANRYFRLNRLINRVLASTPRPNYLVLPELCLPSRWFSRVAYKCGQAGLSVISGIEYKHRFDKPHSGGASVKLVTNRVRASLSTDFLGYPSVVIYEQEKSSPAHEEERELWSIAKTTLLAERQPEKRVIEHGGFRFGLLICSELSDIEFRAAFRGSVDCLFVPEWNRDLDTFASLVEASALDMHSFVVQVNNRKYGDCRVRAPYRESFLRDLARIKGGEDDYFVVAKLDVPALRSFQTRMRSPAKGDFKPIPDGFEIDNARKAVPK